jgi:hypothetical protein
LAARGKSLYKWRSIWKLTSGALKQGLKRARRKKIYKERPFYLRLSYEQGFDGVEEGSQKDGSVGDVFCASISKRPQQASVNFHEINSIPTIGATHLHWAKACLEIKVQLIGVK